MDDDQDLTHYGVKGMRWGVRKDRVIGAYAYAADRSAARNSKKSSKYDAAAKAFGDTTQGRRHARRAAKYSTKTAIATTQADAWRKKASNKTPNNKQEKTTSRVNASNDAAKASASRAIAGNKEKPRRTDPLSNEDLIQAISRMRLEKDFNQLVYDTKPVGKGRAFLRRLGTDITQTETSRVAKGAVALGVETAIATKYPELAKRIKPKKK